MVNLTYRSSPALYRAREWSAGGAIGALRHMEASYLQSWLVGKHWGDWRTEDRWLWRLSTAHGSKGTVGDIGIHLVDFATFGAASDIVSLTSRVKTFHKAEGDRIGNYSSTPTTPSSCRSSSATAPSASSTPPASPPATPTRSTFAVRRQGGLSSTPTAGNRRSRSAPAATLKPEMAEGARRPCRRPISVSPALRAARTAIRLPSRRQYPARPRSLSRWASAKVAVARSAPLTRRLRINTPAGKPRAGRARIAEAA